MVITAHLPTLWYTEQALETERRKTVFLALGCTVGLHRFCCLVDQLEGHQTVVVDDRAQINVKDMPSIVHPIDGMSFEVLRIHTILMEKERGNTRKREEIWGQLAYMFSFLMSQTGKQKSILLNTCTTIGIWVSQQCFEEDARILYL